MKGITESEHRRNIELLRQIAASQNNIKYNDKIENLHRQYLSYQKVMINIFQLRKEYENSLKELRVKLKNSTKKNRYVNVQTAGK